MKGVGERRRVDSTVTFGRKICMTKKDVSGAVSG